MDKKIKHILPGKKFWISIFVIAFVFEAIKKYMNIDVWVLLNKIIPWGAGLTGAAYLFKLVNKDKKDSLKKQEAEESDGFQEIIDRGCEFPKNLFKVAIKNSVVCFVIVMFLFVYLPAASAHFQLIGRAIDLFGGMGYSQTDKPQDEPEKPQKDENKSEKKKEDASKIDKKEILQTDFLADKKRYMKLTPQEYNELYFLTGEHAVLDWSDSKEVERCVADAVKDCIYKQMPNVFDAKAPQDVRDAISQASEDEKVMKNSDDLDRIIEVRMLNWELYPKYSLASLLAGNMQRYAMEYVNANGSFKTIEYYYGQSIDWLFECLTYAGVSDYMLKSVYSSLEMRYNDISDAAEEGTDPQIRALALSKAFKKLQSN